MHTYPAASIGINAQGGQLIVGLTGTIEEILPLMQQGGIDKGVMLGVTPMGDMFDAAWSKLGIESEPRDEDERCQAINAELISRLQRRNTWTCSIAREHPQLIPFVCVDPRMGIEHMIAELEIRVAEGARGLKLHPPAQRFYPSDRRMWPVYAWAQENDVPVVIHSGRFNPGGPWPEYSQPKLFVDLLRDFPTLRVVLAHAGGGWWDQAIELAQTFAQVHFDTSIAFSQVSTPTRPALSDEEVVALIRAFGARRLMFGSEYPWLHPVRDATRVARLPIADAEKRLILAENAQRIYKLD